MQVRFHKIGFNGLEIKQIFASLLSSRNEYR